MMTYTKTKQKKVLTTLISDLDLPPRLTGILYRYNIYTLRDLIDLSWGNYSCFRGIGKIGEAKIQRAVSKTGLDLDAYLAETILPLPLPAHIRRYLIEAGITKISDLQYLDAPSFYQKFANDKKTTLQIVRAFSKAGLDLPLLKDKFIFDTCLSSRTQNILYRAGFFTESQALNATPEKLASIRDVGMKTIEEFVFWKRIQLKNSDDFPVYKSFQNVID